MELASHRSISAQHEPNRPVPELLHGSDVLTVQSLMLASPWTNLMSRAHWPSQYPVPYSAPAALLPPLLPSLSISTKYTAPFKPQGMLDMSTSKEISLFSILNILYSVPSMTYKREPTFLLYGPIVTKSRVTPLVASFTPMVPDHSSDGTAPRAQFLAQVTPSGQRVESH